MTTGRADPNEEESNEDEQFPAQRPGCFSLPIHVPCLRRRGKPLNFLPWIMEPITLFIFAILPLLVLATTEYLFRSSVNEEGLFVRDGDERILLFRKFVAQFFSLFVLVLVGLFYQDLDEAVKVMEPFYHLSKTEGSTGKDSLVVDYVQTPVYFSPFQAWYHSHWAVVCSSSITIISNNVLPTLALGIFGTNEGSHPMHPVYTHVFSGFLGLTAVLISTLLVIISTRSSGLNAFPDDMDTYINLATGMETDNSLYKLFEDELVRKDRDWEPEKKVQEVLGGRAFRSKLRGDTGQLDIIEIEPKRASSNCFTRLGHWWEKQTTTGFLSCWCRFYRRHVSDSHPTWFQPFPLLLISIVLMTLFVIADGQMFWAAKVPFFNVVGEKRFARSIVSTVVNTIIWAQLRKDAMRMEPFYRLKKKGGVCRSDISRKAIWPFQDVFYCLRALKKTKKRERSDVAMFLILLGTYAASIFYITWNTLALNGDTTGFSFWFSYGLQIFCELTMLLAIIAIYCWRSHPILPLQMTTIASKMLLTYATDIDIQEDRKYQRPSDSEDSASIRSQNTSVSDVNTNNGSAEVEEEKAICDEISEKLLYGPPEPPAAEALRREEEIEKVEKDVTVASYTPANSVFAEEERSTTTSYSMSETDVCSPPVPDGRSALVATSPESPHPGPATFQEEGPQCVSEQPSQDMSGDEEKWAFGWFQGRNGKRHVGVCYEKSVEEDYKPNPKRRASESKDDVEGGNVHSS